MRACWTCTCELLLVLALVFVAAARTGGSDSWPYPPSNYGSTLFVSWQVCGDPGEEEVDWTLETLVEGWVAIGIMGLTSDAHQDGDIVAAWIDDAGVGHVVDMWSRDPSSGCSSYGECTLEDRYIGGTDDVLGGATVEKRPGGGMIVKFARKANTADAFDRPILKNAVNRFSWAYYEVKPTSSSGMSDVNLIHCSTDEDCCPGCDGQLVGADQQMCNCGAGVCIPRYTRPSAPETCPACPTTDCNARGHKPYTNPADFWDNAGVPPPCPVRPAKEQEEEPPSAIGDLVSSTLDTPVVIAVLIVLVVPFVFLSVLAFLRSHASLSLLADLDDEHKQ